MKIVYLLTLIITAQIEDYSCTTDMDCECKVTPYEEENTSAACIEYRKQVNAENQTESVEVAKAGAK